MKALAVKVLEKVIFGVIESPPNWKLGFFRLNEIGNGTELCYAIQWTRHVYLDTLNPGCGLKSDFLAAFSAKVGQLSFRV